MNISVPYYKEYYILTNTNILNTIKIIFPSKYSKY